MLEVILQGCEREDEAAEAYPKNRQRSSACHKIGIWKPTRSNNRTDPGPKPFEGCCQVTATDEDTQTKASWCVGTQRQSR